MIFLISFIAFAATICQGASLPAAENLALEARFSSVERDQMAVYSLDSQIATHFSDIDSKATISCAAISTSLALTKIICSTPNVSPLACVGTGVLSVVSSFFLAYVALSTRDSDLLRGDHLQVAFPPTPSCNHRCQLDLNVPSDGEWMMIGNYTAETGEFHTIHFMQTGKLKGLRSIETTNTELGKRQAQFNDGGVVVDYYWDSSNEAAYDDFGSTSASTTSASTFITNEFSSSDDVVLCACFSDSVGKLANGLMTVSGDGVALSLIEGAGEIETLLDGTCSTVG